MEKYSSQLPIGVFDSGVGGLTVLKSLREALPNERFIYLGDTARLPYGTKTPKTVSRYAVQAVSFLVDEGIKFLVVACNTATALALPLLREHFPNLPMIGVIEPGARKALAVSKNKRIAVIATQATVASKGYDEALLGLDRDAQVLSKPAPLLVAIAEEGLLSGEIPCLAVQHYLASIMEDQGFNADTLILGCTHFPALHQAINSVVAGRMQVIDSAHSVALEVKDFFIKHPDVVAERDNSSAQIKFMVTDGVGRFMQVAQVFLASAVDADSVVLVDLD